MRRRVQQLEQAALHLERRLGAPFVNVDAPLRDIARSARTVERLRLCLLWTFSDRLVRMDPIPIPAGENYQVRGNVFVLHRGCPFHLLVSHRLAQHILCPNMVEFIYITLFTIAVKLLHRLL